MKLEVRKLDKFIKVSKENGFSKEAVLSSIGMTKEQRNYIEMNWRQKR